MTLPTTPDVAIIGAGPAGIGTAVALEAIDVEFVVLERDCIGASFRQWPEEMRLLTPSFPANAFGVRDLNAITLDTSPALALDCEHPTGDQYADYLEAVAAFHDLPIHAGIEVDRVVPNRSASPDPSRDVEPDTSRFTLETTEGPIESEYVVWAAGQYGYPSNGSIPGAEHAVHVSTVDSWAAYAERWSADRSGDAAESPSTTEPDRSGRQRVAADGAGAAGPITDDIVIVGGAESGIDAALGLVDAGCSVTVLDDDGPWQYRSPDPSEVLSPRTSERLEAALTDGRALDLVTGARADAIDRTQTGPVRTDDDGYVVRTTAGDWFRSRAPPLLATGFDGSLALVEDLFDYGSGEGDEEEDMERNGSPELTDRDESTETPGLFLTGPQVAHDGQKFCFIYKFRQRFAVVAETIGDRLGVDTGPLEAYREKQMFLEDLECCDPDYCDC
ncbi:NAD(P)-binding domain-containing protein [Natronorubrum sp. JWXQ-INN-674]|uniref:NAD(P)-binding domain-containing protein n=1 Tax=Natronorubrum halalkaliphilum TaxID=2691917 RepID=A0A6B0VQ00_9EURY|nr:NAD(P)/FAD-dependent oxidoreductase [Natronorubrum halalkaliphilum]MXV63578.1 NAD(P)-binding domain-containing protein [Natronorubrum halalkaliphilum]